MAGAEVMGAKQLNELFNVLMGQNFVPGFSLKTFVHVGGKNYYTL